jgi:dipeptidyl aminopeptidase/acylaminoacyl peptidase
MTRAQSLLVFAGILLATCLATAQAQKPPISIDDHFNSVSFADVKVSPDGSAVVIATERADWDQQIFRRDLWLYREDGHGGGNLAQLTRSGHDSDPQWSPDGKWIAFFSDRNPSTEKTEVSIFEETENDYQLYLISASGGEGFPVTDGNEEVHAFTWSADSQTLFYSTRQPWTKDQKDAHKNEWKDVIQYRGGMRGDTIFSIGVSDVLARHQAQGTKETPESEKGLDVTAGSKVIAQTPLRVEQLAASDDGRQLAFVSESTSERQEKIEHFEIFSVDLEHTSLITPPRQLTRNEAVEQSIRWASDNRHVIFEVDVGSVEGKYKDTQMRMFWLDTQSGKVERWGEQFGGALGHYSVSADGSVLALGRLGTQVQMYSAASPAGGFAKREGWAGTYELVSVGKHSPRVAFAYSALERPAEIYLAEGADKLAQARPITVFNKVFTERDLPKGKPYHWTADDGTSVEGMLMYPPGKFEAKHLPMFVLIHGGPADADGDGFEADWYQWDRLAATQGWLVLEPNYRGSTGYGDKFLMGIVPQMVSRPGKDILEGVDALVKEGIADPDHLAVGGYSYGGYMTNWLITQSTQWKTAVTGAGSVEHVGDWGNDDTTFDDAYFLGGRPWEAAKLYQDEAAIYQFGKVTTPTHIVGGEDDVRVAVEENYLLDEALYSRGIPEELLVFPGEGHSLDKNPWHGKIKVREELKWLQKYGGVGTAPAGGQ